MKRTLALIMILTMVLLAACGGAAAKPETPAAATPAADATAPAVEPVVFTVNTNNPGDPNREAVIAYMAEQIPARTEGRVKLDVIPSGTMGNETELTQSCSNGSIDIVLVAEALIAANYKELGFISMPGICSNYDEADEVFFGDGWVAQAVRETCLDHGMTVLGECDNGFRALGSTKDCQTPADLKGVKARCGNTATTVALYEKLGMLPTSIDSSEILTALENGTIDATDNSIVNIVANGTEDSVSYILNLNYSYSANAVMVNTAKYDLVSDEDKAVMKAVTEEACATQIKANRALATELVEKNTASGKWVVYDNSEEMQAAIDAAALEVAKEFADKYDAVYMDKIVAGFAK